MCKHEPFDDPVTGQTLCKLCNRPILLAKLVCANCGHDKENHQKLIGGGTWLSCNVWMKDKNKPCRCGTFVPKPTLQSMGGPL